jgi:uncharacterized protein (DUF362 family)
VSTFDFAGEGILALLMERRKEGEMADHRIAISGIRNDLRSAIQFVMEHSGIATRLKHSPRIAIKPNFTYPYHKPGVSTSPTVIQEIVKILCDYTNHIAIVETDGGYGTWEAREAFEGHAIYHLSREYGVEVVNLCQEPSESIFFQSGCREHQLPLPSRLLHETDLLISMPVPKIHCMTGLSLGYKNQWGCVPDIMRLRRHYLFDDAIVAINRALKPAVIADGTFFLDMNGPMEGIPIFMDLIIAASDAGTFDRYVSELMNFSWRRVGHLRRAAALKDMPERLDDISCHTAPGEIRFHAFRLKRTFRNHIALLGFKSRTLTWLGYESWFGRVIIHRILYAIAGKPIKPRAEGKAL